MTAAALNHRDLFIRQHLYPGVAFNVPLLADGCGIVEEAGSAAARWKGKRVILVPGQGWDSSPEGPDGEYAILGGTSGCHMGTLQEYVCIEASNVEEAPEHLSDNEAAALPLTGLTAWRAFVAKSGNAVEGRNILVTGIGGGVALMALMLGKGTGANVFVTSGSEDKIKKAVELGASGGVNYRENGWEKKLKASLPPGRPYLDAVLDGAGGDIAEKATKILKVSQSPSSYSEVN
jgi:NADPH:quinone reductase-like Zn-dependent oxidoreductase